MPEPCGCCRGSLPAVSILVRRPVVGRSVRGGMPSPDRQHRLCRGCHSWLALHLRRIKGDEAAASRLIGAPSAAGRQVLFPDQCHLCRSPLGDGAAQIDAVFAENATVDWSPTLVCGSCDRWVASLVSDGRSLQGSALREIDGPYGSWLHPNLRSLTVELQVADITARDAIATACDKMGVQVAAPDGAASVALVELGPQPAQPAHAPRRILLLSLPQCRQLLSELGPDVVGWLTLPVTPHQVAAALGRAVAMPGVRLLWDADSGLPIASLRDYARAALVVTPGPGVEAVEVGWLVKRFARGYDEVVSFDGQVVLLPRAPASHTGAVAARLQKLLGDRCSVVPLPLEALGRRFEASA